MIKVILFAVIGLLVGLGGGSAVSVMKAKKAYAADVAHKAQLVADSLAKAEEEGGKHVASKEKGADSTAHDSTATDSAVVKGEGGKGAEHAPPTDVATHDAPPPKVEAAPAKHEPAPATPKTYSRAVKTVEANGTRPEGTRTATRPSLPPKPLPAAPVQPGAAKVAKIFAAMPPKDAAKVLEQLDDAEVQSVISAVSEKQAAAILQSFPPARAAAISKAVLRSHLPVKP
jgi:hypothetical protein